MLKKLSMVVSVLALLTLVLAGCANGMLREDEATVNGHRNSSGSRSAYITITNFAPTNGPMRTIAPDQIDGGDLGNYVFVATGNNPKSGEMTPKIVTVEQDGTVSLADLDPGVWTVTITAYDKAKLGTVTDAADIVDTQHDEKKALSGTAAIDLSNTSSSAVITLTPDRVSGPGDVNLQITLDQEDVREITGAPTKYEVSIGIYKKITGEPLDPNQLDKLRGNQVNQAATVFQHTGAPKGQYTFKVIISTTDPDKKRSWVYSDEIAIEPTRVIDKPLTIPQLIGKKPGDPVNFAVLWDPNVTANADDVIPTYIATFAWERGTEKNEQEFLLDIADITDFYNPKTNEWTDKTTFQRGNGEDLWQKIEADGAPVQKMNMGNFDQGKFPLYNDGSLMAGNTSISFQVPAGRVYTARIKASNDNGESGTVYLNATKPQGQAFANLDVLSENLPSFEVIAITYKLEGTKLIQSNQQNNIISSNIVFKQYIKNGYDVEYLAYDNAAGGARGDGYWLFEQAQNTFNEAGRIKWTKWVDPAGNEYDQGTPYQEPKNVTLTPNAAGAGSAAGGTVDIESAGTYANAVREETIFVKAEATEGAPTWSTNDKLNEQANINGTTPGFGKLNNQYTVNIPANTQTKQYVKFIVGSSDGNTVTPGEIPLTPALNQDDRKAEVLEVTYTVEKFNGDIVKTATGTKTSPGVIEFRGLNSGDYVLRVRAVFTSGKSSQWQGKLVVRYDND